jgi:hypothetical protein
MRQFDEKQSFTQWWIQLINFSLLALLAVFLYKWFFLKEAVDKVSATDSTGQLVVTITIVLSFLLIYLFRLKTRIDENGLHYRFLPFHFSDKTISWYDIDKCYIRTYSPIGEYGGWGIRYSPKNGKAFNVKGNKGIQIEFKNGKKILLGTQKPEEAQQVINKYMKNERI